MAGWTSKDDLLTEVFCNNTTGGAADFDVIAAPGVGLKIVIMAIECQANASILITFKAGASTIARRNAYVNAPIHAHDPSSVFVLPENTKFVVNTNANSLFAGWIKYRIVAA